MSTVPEDILRARHVIGLDIGDGESALAWSTTGHDDPINIYQRQRTAETSILTAFSWQGTRYLIGEEAVLAKDAVQFKVNFKGHRQAIQSLLFGEALLSEFFEANPDVQENCLIFIGHPTGWPAGTVVEYHSYLDRLGPSVRLLPESQSALVYVRDRNSDRSEALDNVLVVDIGSSTVDFTVVEDMIPRNIAVGADLGCSEIDMQLASMAKTALARNAEFIGALANSGGEDLLLLACRRAKEAQFSGRMPSLLDNRASHDESLAPIADFGFGWLRGQEIPRLVTQPGGWASKFEQLVGEVKDNVPRPPTTVILTGGGSRMPFVRGICQRAFPAAAIDHDNDPSLSVARGLASAGSQRVRVARFRSDIRDIVASAETRAYIRSQTDSAFQGIRDAIAEEMRHQDRATWPRLVAHPPKQEQAVYELQRSISTYLVPKAQEVCVEYGIDSEQFGINFTLPQLFATQLMESISRAAKSMRMPKNAVLTTLSIGGYRLLRHRTLKPDAVSIAAFAASFALDEGRSWYMRQRAIKNVLAAELPAETAEPLIDEILVTIIDLMDKRASTVERFVV